MSATVVEARFTGRLGAFSLDCALTVPGQGITALVGPSGSGKTTLLRCIAGLARLTGSLIVGGEVWQDGGTFLPPHRRAVGYVFQEPSLLPHLSVQGNLAYARRRAGGSAAISYDEVVSLLGLSALLSRSTDALSGGERQRVAIGRALLSQPALLLMDEPLASLDEASKAEIMPFLERLHETLKLPILYVTHDPSEVRRLADQVLMMTAGRVEAMSDDGRADAEAQLARLSPEDVQSLALAAIEAGLSL